MLAAGLAVPATVVGRLVPVVGGPVAGIVLGVLATLLLRPGERLRSGIAFAATVPLQTSVVLLGCQLSLGQVARVGLTSLPVMLGTLAACLLVAHLLGRALGVVRDLRTLIGVGTGICGASAIAAITPVIDAAGTDVAYAVSTIFVFNVAAVLLFPPLGHLMGMDQHAFGLFAGTAVNDTSSVVAAATAYGPVAAHDAVVVKLARTLMIVPVSLGLAALGRRAARPVTEPGRAAGLAPGAHSAAAPAPAARTLAGPRPVAHSAADPSAAAGPGADLAPAARSTTDPGPAAGPAEDRSPAADVSSAAGPRPAAGPGPVRIGRLVPWFLVGFLLTAGLNTAGLVPSVAHGAIADLATFLITVALTAIGLSTDLSRLRRTGPRPLLLGGCLWLTVAGSSLLLQTVAGRI